MEHVCENKIYSQIFLSMKEERRLMKEGEDVDWIELSQVRGPLAEFCVHSVDSSDSIK
jgi:hypothetical protein